MRLAAVVLLLGAAVTLSACGGDEGGSGLLDETSGLDAAEMRGTDLPGTEHRPGGDVLLFDTADLPDAVKTEVGPTDGAGADAETLDAGACAAGCDDGDDCTYDWCDPEAGCVHDQIEDCCDGKTAYNNEFAGEEALAEVVVADLVGPHPDKPDLEPMLWSLSEERFHSPPAALYFGDPMKKSYDNGHRVAASATLGPFALEAGSPQSLEFWAYAGIEEGIYSDFLTVQVVSDGDLVPVWSKGEFTKVDEWLPVLVDLTPFAGKEIELVFLFDSGDEHENSGEGVYIDDILVERGCLEIAPCDDDIDCYVLYSCVQGTCDGGECAWGVVDDCCLSPADCEDWDGCTIDKCADGLCVWQDDPDPMCCNANDECSDDDDVCTVDVCKNHYCAFLPSGAEGCCVTDSDCNDQDSCTTDFCAEMSCIHINLCCTEDGDCNDGDDLCTEDLCDNGYCAFVPTGAEGCCLETLLTEGFESGLPEEWQFESDSPGTLTWEVSAMEAYEGSMSLVCEGTGIDFDVSATAVLPIDFIPPVDGKLTFWLKMQLEESGDCSENSLSVTIDGEELATYCNSILNWFKVEVDLDEYGGNWGELALELAVDPWSWDGAGYAVYVDGLEVTQDCCNSNSECDDGNACTEDLCPALNSICKFVPIDGCCLSSLDCNDGDPCTLDQCQENECDHIDQCCTDDLECDDGDDICTTDLCINSFCQFLSSGEPGCCTPEVYAESFEFGDMGGWEFQSDSAIYTWHLTDTTANTGSWSLYFGNESVTDYGSDSLGTATSPPIDVPGGASVTLSLAALYDTESCCDEVTVQVIDADGNDTDLGELAGDSGGWETVEYDISQFSNQTVRLAFLFDSDVAVESQGVFIDDLSIELECCSEDQECEDDNPCTMDSCPGLDSLCLNVPIENCCVSNGDCNDGEICTQDSCEEGECQHLDICCQDDIECDDADDVCTIDVCSDGFCEYFPTGEAGCCIGELYVDDFETGSLADYEVDNQSGQGYWHITDVDANGGVKSLAFTDNYGESYGSDASGTIVTGPIDVPDLAVQPQLEFWTRYYTESCCDKWSISVIHDEGVEVLETLGGMQEEWFRKFYPLDAYAGQTIQVRFIFDSDGSLSYEGVFIDDLGVVQNCCSQDADCDDNDPCTIDSCPALNSQCIFEPVPECCESDIACDDGDQCTMDSCVENVCQNIEVCCEKDEDCDDGDPDCTTDTCVDGTCQFQMTPIAGCCFPKVVLFDFEGDALAVWESTQGSDEFGWKLSTSKAAQAQQSLYFGNDQENSYGSNSEGTLLSPKFTIPLAPSATFIASVWTDSEGGYDELEIILVKDGIEYKLETLSGQSPNWLLVTHDISAFMGSTVQVKLTFDSDGSKEFTGVYVDGIKIEVACCDTDEDCDDGNPCTLSTCPGPGGMCVVEQVDGCCLSNENCSDTDDCTLDQCNAGVCTNMNICCEKDEDCVHDQPGCYDAVCGNDGVCAFELLEVDGCCHGELFAAGFEYGGLADYLVDNDQMDFGWQVTTAVAAEGLASLGFTNGGGDSYGNSSSGTVRTPEIFVPQFAESPMLRFQARYHTESCCDSWWVAAVHQGGSKELGLFKGEQDWSIHEFDLSEFAGQTIRLEFGFESDGGVNYDGVFIDALAVVQKCCSADEDCDDANPCSADTCPAAHSKCNHAPVEGCCLEDVDCFDGDECTYDACTGENVCAYLTACCSQDSDCDDGDDLCTADVCVGDMCLYEATGAEGCCLEHLFYDDFSTDKGWVYGQEWERGEATASSCTEYGEEDPATDHTDSQDNYIAGVIIGGCTPEIEHDYYFLTSPIIEAPTDAPVYLSYWRWLSSDYSPYMTNAVQVLYQGDWETIWVTGTSPGHMDEEWEFHELEITEYASSELRVRFGYKIENDITWSTSSWNIDDVAVYSTWQGLCCAFNSDCAGFEAQCIDGICQ